MSITKAINIKALFCGFVAELLLNLIVCGATLLMVKFQKVESGSNPGFADGSDLITTLKVTGIIVSALLYAVVGFIVGTIAKKREVSNALALATIFIVYAFFRLKSMPSLLEIITIIEIPLFHAFGGFLARHLRVRQATLPS